MESNTTHIRSLVEKYLNNQCTVQDLEHLFLHIRKHPDDPVLDQLMDADAIRAATSSEKLPELISADLRVKLRNELFENGRTIPSKAFPSHHRYTLHWRVAAVLIPLFICIGIFYFQRNSTREMLVKTSFGEVKTITLPDNSTVVLNGNSTLRYDGDWSVEKPREVTLYGEGFFKVIHHHNHEKFLVHTSNDFTIEVLGTQFNVNSRRDRTQVVLKTGKIRLEMQNRNLNQILMKSGDYAEVNKQGRIIRKIVDTQQYVSWQNKKLVFKGTPLSEILSILEDNYGYKANVRDSLLLDETFTATYPADDVDVLLVALSKSFKITIDRTGKKIEIGS